MPHYRVRLTKEVQDTLDAIVIVEADTEQEAADKALDQATAMNSTIGWEFAYAGESDAPEVDSIDECEPEEASDLGDDPLGDWHGRNE
jgi:hypothetical protein